MLSNCSSKEKPHTHTHTRKAISHNNDSKGVSLHLTTKISKPENLHQIVYVENKGDKKNPYTNNSNTLQGEKED